MGNESTRDLPTNQQKFLNSVNRAGRPPGTVNRYTKLKASFLEAFYTEELGGVQGLVQWACKNNENRTTFYKLIVHLIPKDLNIKGDGDSIRPTKVVINVTDSSVHEDDMAGEEGVTIDCNSLTEKQLPDETVKQLAEEKFGRS